MNSLLSKVERDAFWQRLSQTFPHVPAELAFDVGSADGPEMKHGTSVLACRYSLDGEHIFAAGGGRLPGCDSSIRVFDSDAGHEMLVCRGHIHGIYQLALHPRTGLLASASEDFSVIVWNLEQQDAIFLVGGDPIVKGHVAFATEKNWIAIGETEAYDGLGNSVFVVELDSGKEIFRHRLQNSKEITGLVISPDGEKLFVAVAEYQHSPCRSELYCWSLTGTTSQNWLISKFRKFLASDNATGGQCVWKAALESIDIHNLHGMAGDHCLVASIMEHEGGCSSGACLFDVRSGSVLAKRILPGIGASVAVSPDGQTLAIAHGEGGIELVRSADLALVKVLAEKGDQSSFCSVQFSPDGKTVLAGLVLHSPIDGMRGKLKAFDV